MQFKFYSFKKPHTANCVKSRALPLRKGAHRVFPPCGEDKAQHIAGGVRATDCLLDDYTKNLVLWHPPGQGIKLLNGINDTHGTWQHERISYSQSPAELAQSIVEVMQGPEALRKETLKNQTVSLADRLAAAKQEAAKQQEPQNRSQHKQKDNLQR